MTNENNNNNIVEYARFLYFTNKKQKKKTKICRYRVKNAEVVSENISFDLES